MSRSVEKRLAILEGKPIASPASTLTAYQLAAAIRQRYEAPEWLVESELTLDGRRLDLVAFNMWGSREHRVVGFEIKVSRGDWMRELAQLQKSERWMEVVDSFYVVTPPKLIQLEELPRGWGLLELCGTRMMTRAHAEQRPAQRTLPRELSARLVTRVHERVSSADRAAEYASRDSVRAEIKQQLTAEFERGTRDMRLRLETLERERGELHAACGLTQDWGPHKKLLAGAVLLADLQAKNINGDDAWVTRQLQQMIEQNEQRIGMLRNALKQIATEHAA